MAEFECKRCGKCCHAGVTLTSKCQNKELGPITGEWWL